MRTFGIVKLILLSQYRDNTGTLTCRVNVLHRGEHFCVSPVTCRYFSNLCPPPPSPISLFFVVFFVLFLFFCFVFVFFCFVFVFFSAHKRSLGQGNIFIGMCQEFCSRGGWGCLLPQGSHSTWKTWKNEGTPGKPGNIMEF